MRAETLKHTIISPDLLRSMGACGDQIVLFAETFGESAIEISPDIIRRAAAAGLDLEWASEELLTDPARDACEQVKATAMAAYMQVMAPARAAYMQVMAPAMAAAMARAAYKQATATAQAAYEQAKATAMAAFRQAAATALINILFGDEAGETS